MLRVLQLQSSLRNALATFGPDSVQYREIKFMVDEYAAGLALGGLSLGGKDVTMGEGEGEGAKSG